MIFDLDLLDPRLTINQRLYLLDFSLFWLLFDESSLVRVPVIFDDRFLFLATSDIMVDTFKELQVFILVFGGITMRSQNNFGLSIVLGL